MNRTLALLVILVSVTAVLAGGGCHANNPPVVMQLSTRTPRPDISTSSLIECLASDSDDDTLSYTWSAAAGTITGSGPEVTWTAPDTAGTYQIQVNVTDEHGAVATSGMNIEVRANRKPAIQSIAATPSVVRPGRESTVTCMAADPDRDTLMYTWFAENGSVTGNGSSAAWIVPETPGTYVISVEISDGRGGTASTDTEVIVQGNQPPEIQQLKARTLEAAPGTPVTIECTAIDPESDSLTYSWTASGGEIIGEGPAINWRAPDIYGNYFIRVIVEDGRGGKAEQAVTIDVQSCG